MKPARDRGCAEEKSRRRSSSHKRWHFPAKRRRVRLIQPRWGLLLRPPSAQSRRGSRTRARAAAVPQPAESLTRAPPKSQVCHPCRRYHHRDRVDTEAHRAPYNDRPIRIEDREASSALVARGGNPAPNERGLAPAIEHAEDCRCREEQQVVPTLGRQHRHQHHQQTDPEIRRALDRLPARQHPRGDGDSDQAGDDRQVGGPGTLSESTSPTPSRTRCSLPEQVGRAGIR